MEEELDNILASIDLELSIQRANIALTNTTDYLKKQSPHNTEPKLSYTPDLKEHKYQPLPFNNQVNFAESQIK